MILLSVHLKMELVGILVKILKVRNNCVTTIFFNGYEYIRNYFSMTVPGGLNDTFAIEAFSLLDL